MQPCALEALKRKRRRRYPLSQYVFTIFVTNSWRDVCLKRVVWWALPVLFAVFVSGPKSKPKPDTVMTVKHYKKVATQVNCRCLPRIAFLWSTEGLAATHTAVKCMRMRPLQPSMPSWQQAVFCPLSACSHFHAQACLLTSTCGQTTGCQITGVRPIRISRTPIWKKILTLRPKTRLNISPDVPWIACWSTYVFL